MGGWGLAAPSTQIVVLRGATWATGPSSSSAEPCRGATIRSLPICPLEPGRSECLASLWRTVEHPLHDKDPMSECVAPDGGQVRIPVTEANDDGSRSADGS